MELGSCRVYPPETMFPDDSTGVMEAQEICGGCIVRATCLEYALTHREMHGIWGGVSERGRRKLLQQRRAASL